MARRDRPHLVLHGTERAERYASPLGRGKTLKLPARDREAHGRALLEQLRSAWTAADAARQERAAVGLPAATGTYLEFRSDVGSELALESLSNRPAGIELVAVRVVEDTQIATVFVPHGKVEQLTKRIEQYVQEETKSGRPKNRPLVESIAGIRLAVLESFWTDEPALFPAAGERITWEVWLRRRGDETSAHLERLANLPGVALVSEAFLFIELAVVLVVATREELSATVEVLDLIAELRLAKSAAGWIERPREARAEIERLRQRITVPSESAPAVCLVDSGVDRGHPLLEGALHPRDCHVFDPSWPAGDLHGHGTEMAGLALLGDLALALAARDPVALGHRLESVTAIHPSRPHEPANYGLVTAQCVYRAEIAAPDRARAFCMAIATADDRDRGRPSLWSAAVDDLAAGTADGKRRLFVLSAGNVPLEARRYYPERNLVDQVHDPGQSWNALTVGAYTERVALTEARLAGWRPVAPLGALSPSSTTSVTWDSKKWPLKPDIVLEGGNSAVDPSETETDEPDSLSMLTTSRTRLGRLLAATGDTSAAAAQAARMAAIVQARYPLLWPETVRALLVHAAEWTPAMHAQASNPKSRSDWERGLRMFGFGVPSLERATASADNDLTLIVQSELQPFDDDGRMNEMHVHALPWPREVLRDLGDARVELRVTLSYFVEASPGRRGWGVKHRYASHGLRLDVQTATESVEQFRARVNTAARDDAVERTTGDSADWWLGPNVRAKGSVHHDRWRGTAADLAERAHIAVYPVLGWWRERRHLRRATRRARYGLVVGIRTPDVDADVYSAVLNQLSIELGT